MKNRNGKKEKMPANRSKNPGSSVTAGVATAVPASRPGTPPRPANPFEGTKPGGPGAPKPTGLGAKAPTGPATDHTEGARLAQEAIRKDPSVPENYAALAGALRMLAQFLRTRNPEGADNLVNMADPVRLAAHEESPDAGGFRQHDGKDSLGVSEQGHRRVDPASADHGNALAAGSTKISNP